MRAIIIHGTGGAPEDNWFPWLAKELRKRNCLAVVPRFPGPEEQNLKSWTKVSEKSIGILDENDIIFGHSLGAAFTLRLLEKSAAPVKAAFLVAGFVRKLGISEFDLPNQSFIADPFDWKAIRTKAKHFGVYHADNDPYVPLALGEELCTNLETDMKLIPGGGHLNTKAGFTSFELLLEDLDLFCATE